MMGAREGWGDGWGDCCEDGWGRRRRQVSGWGKGSAVKQASASALICAQDKVGGEA